MKYLLLLILSFSVMASDEGISHPESAVDPVKNIVDKHSNVLLRSMAALKKIGDDCQSKGKVVLMNSKGDIFIASCKDFELEK